jgi:hypothetical protein
MAEDKVGYEKDLEIDKYALDTECMDQPRKFSHWAEVLAEATAERDRADQNVDVVKAQIETAMRADPVTWGLDKVTDASIKAAVTQNDKVVHTVEALIKAKYRVNVLFAAKEAFEQRKSMLENLVKLFLSGYWSDPRIPKEGTEAGGRASEDLQKNMLNKKLAGRVKK